jgi:hypothetical protein
MAKKRPSDKEAMKHRSYKAPNTQRNHSGATKRHKNNSALERAIVK